MANDKFNPDYKYSPALENGKLRPSIKSVLKGTPFIETLTSGNLNFLYAFNGDWVKFNVNAEDELRVKKLGIGLSNSDPITYDLTLNDGLQFGNPSYTAGSYKFDGAGFLFDYNNSYSGESFLSIDNILVRKTLTVFDLLIIQKRFTNGSLFISNGAKVASVNGTTITFEDPTKLGACPFAAGDLIFTIRFRMDSTTVMKSCYATVSSVSGNSAVVSYDSGTFSVGDEVARVGNTTDATRQGMVYLTSDDTTAPYIDIVTGVSSWAAWNSTNKVVARLGRLKDLPTTSFGTLPDVIGLYLKNNIYIDDGSINMGTTGYVRAGQTAYNTGSGFWLGYTGGVYKFSLGNSTTNYITWDNTTLTVAGTVNIVGGTGFPNTYYSASTSPPATPKLQDIWYQTDTGKMVRYNGSAWQDTANDTTLALTTGVSLSGGGITLGTSAAFKSGMTSYVDTTNAGFFLGLVTSVPKFKMQNAGSTKYFLYDGADLSLVGGTITGGTIQTATSGQRIVMAGATNDIKFYDSFGNLTGTIYGIFSSPKTILYILGDEIVDITATTYVRINSKLTIPSHEFSVGTKFDVNSSGQLTRVNDLVASSYTGYVLGSDGTSYTPLSLTTNDFNYSAGAISIDYTNGQAASTSTKGFLTSTDWNTFNGKIGASDNNVLTGSISFTPDAFTLTATATISATAKKTVSVTPTSAYDNLTTISDGTDGQELTIVNVNASYNILIDESGNIYNGGAAVTLSQYQTASYVYINGLTKWVLKSTTGSTA